MDDCMRVVKCQREQWERFEDLIKIHDRSAATIVQISR